MLWEENFIAQNLKGTKINYGQSNQKAKRKWKIDIRITISSGLSLLINSQG